LELESINLLKKQLAYYKPKYVICAAGISGKPTIAWCESNKIETINTNITYQLILANICKELGIHLTIYMSGSVYLNNCKCKCKYNCDCNCKLQYDETIEPNNTTTHYTQCRIILEQCLKHYDNVLLLRIQYPISFNSNPKCFFNKMKTRLNTINNVNVNLTIIPDLFPLLPNIIENKNGNNIGIYNFVNEGSIKLSQLLDICNINDYKLCNSNNINNNTQLGLLNINKLKQVIPVMKVEDAIRQYAIAY
jgi:nucleoside-diphosphate-sugar epimerase